jgi:decaprenyl-phosphate phosphoribosyltransferase
MNMTKTTAMICLMRPAHWIKNAIVLFPVVFAMRTGDLTAWRSAGLATVAFCLASSAIYIFNDIRDRAADQLHPRKKDRPLASGQIGTTAATLEALCLLIGAIGVALLVNNILPAVVTIYVLLQFAYTLLLKHKAIVDVICIALGFVLRAVAGAVAIDVEVSPWLFVCTFTICLFMGFCKRCNELATLTEPQDASGHRKTLAAYSSELLTHLMTLSASVAVVAFLLYASNERTVEHFGTNYLMYTLPIVVYGITRFAMLSMQGVYSDPTDLFLHDRPFQLTVVIWFSAVVVIIQWGRELQSWLGSLAAPAAI